jgi:Zn-dependent oligopeptidase
MPRLKRCWIKSSALRRDLYTRRKANPVSHLNAAGQRVNASLGELLTNQATNENEEYRRSSQNALRELEQWLLHNGLPELISLRNRFARQMGFRNYFDYKVNKTERMTPEQLFAILDRFEQQTREANSRSLQQLAAGEGVNQAHGTLERTFCQRR